MTDTPLDLDAIRWRAERTAEMPMPGPRLTFVLNNDVPALLAEVETLRTQLAEAQLEATKLATEGEWETEYGYVEPGRGGEQVWCDGQCAGIGHTIQRQVWRGPVQAVEETTE